MNLSLFSLIFIINSFYYFVKLHVYKIITLLLISTLLNSLSFNINLFNFKIEYFLYFFLFISFIARSIFFNKKLYFKYDYTILLIIYLLFSYPIIKLLYPDLLVWPAGNSALSTDISKNKEHLIELRQSYTFFKQIFFILAPLFFFYFVKSLNVEKIQHSLRIYIKAIIIICTLNLLIFLIIELFHNVEIVDKVINFLNLGKYRYTSFQSNFVRVSLFMGEPSFASIFIIPIIIYYLANILSQRINLNLKNTLILFILLSNIILMASSSALISLFLCFLMLIICNFKSKKMIIILSTFLFILIIFLLSNNILIENFFAKFDLENKFSSIYSRLWSIEHSFGLLLQSPLLGTSIGTSAATSGLVVFITSVGLIGLYIFIRISNLNIVVKYLHKKKQNRELFILSNFIISILICNILAGDITTFITPIYFLLIIIFKYKFQKNDLSR